MIDERPLRPGSSVEVRISRVDGVKTVPAFDRVATEEPLELRVRAGGETRTLAITMRTPGHDFELAAGFLYNEGLIDGVDALRGMSFCMDVDIAADQQYNIVNADLSAAALPPLVALERHFTTTSACGVCGRAQLESLEERGLAPLPEGARIDPAVLTALPEKLRAAQGVFEKTGGLHAAGIFTLAGELIVLREDVGRHNALDKAIGWALLQRRLPLEACILLVSGRTSYEIVQKALVARIPIVAAISAPSSLAVALAQRFNVTLAGFLRNDRFNVYAGATRVATIHES